MKDTKCYFIYSKKFYCHDGNIEKSISEILNFKSSYVRIGILDVDTYYFQALIVCDAKELDAAKEKLAENGVFVQDETKS